MSVTHLPHLWWGSDKSSSQMVRTLPCCCKFAPLSTLSPLRQGVDSSSSVSCRALLSWVSKLCQLSRLASQVLLLLLLLHQLLLSKRICLAYSQRENLPCLRAHAQTCKRARCRWRSSS